MTLERVMFRAIVPALLLPVIGSAAAIIGTSNSPSDGGDSGPIMGLVVVVYLFVLLGSMTLNGWLLLRHPDSFALRTLPRRTALLLASLCGLLVVWIVLLALGIVGVAGFLFGGAIAALSIVSCVDAVVRRIKGSAGVAIASIGLSVSARVIGITYVVIAALGVLGLIGSFATGMDASQAGGILGGPWTWALIVLGLPWSWPLYLVSIVLLFTVGDSVSAPVYFVAPTLAALSVIANIVLVSLLVWHPTCRTALTNWFFRLKRAAAPVVETPPPAA